MAKEYSQWNKAGQKYVTKPKAKPKSDGRRTPRRDRQVARGKRFDDIVAKRVKDSRRGRFGSV